MILVFTHANDIGADLVIRHLARRRLAYRRINTELIGTPALRIGTGSGGPFLSDASGRIEARGVTALWARRFAHSSVLDHVDPGYRDFARREFAYLLDAFLAAVGGVQINPFEVDRLSGNRLVQAARAQDAGLRVPDTIVSQDAGSVHAFVARHGAAVTKAISYGLLGGKGAKHAYTALAGPDFNMSGLSACPGLFQAFIPKRCEWRVTTVGARIFAARTRRDAVVDAIDWRRSPDPLALFEAAELPAEVEEKLNTLCVRSGLLFGTHDLIETPSGDFYFLETNPAGQWGWLEVRLGLPIGEAIAALLESGGHPC